MSDNYHLINGYATINNSDTLLTQNVYPPTQKGKNDENQ